MTNHSFVVILNRLKETLFDRLVARKKKVYTRNGLTKPIVLGIENIANMILVLNYYLSRFPEPEIKAFATGDMIKMVLCMIPKD